jgi:hypothetical protein
MKKKLITLLFAPVFLFNLSSASAQIYVNVRPVVPVVVRTPAPSPAHIWIDEEWEPYGTTYRWGGGYWATPPHEGYRWEHGYWRRHGNDGEEWVRGHWVR